jgi:hypothetical protein
MMKQASAKCFGVPQGLVALTLSICVISDLSGFARPSADALDQGGL